MVARSEQRPILAATIVLAVLAPVGFFLLVRIPYGCSVLNFLALPWDPPVELAVQVIASAIALAAFALVVRGFFYRGAPRTASIIILSIWVASVPVWFFLLLLSTFGDPDPTNCAVR